MNLRHFISSETGAVTVDWVVLTGGLVGLGLATMSVVSGGVEDLSDDISSEMSRENGKPIIRTAFTTDGPFVIDNETLSGIIQYGETGATLEASDALGAVSGDNAYVITSSLLNENGAMAGGLLVDVPDDPLEVGETYRLSFWARSEDADVAIRGAMYGRNESGSRVLDNPSANNQVVGSEWTYIEKDYVATTAGDRILIATDALGATFAVDNINFEKVR